MDTLDNNEIEGIWDRVKKNLDVSKLHVQAGETLSEAIERTLKSQGDYAYSNNVSTLISKGFPDRAAGVDSIQKEFETGIPIVEIPIQKPVSFSERLFNSGAISRTTSGRIRVPVSGKTRAYSEKTVSFKPFTWKGKEAYSTYHNGKRVSWGLV